MAPHYSEVLQAKSSCSLGASILTPTIIMSFSLSLPPQLTSSYIAASPHLTLLPLVPSFFPSLPLLHLSLNPIHSSWVTNLIGVQRRSGGKPGMKQKRHSPLWRSRDEDSDGQSNWLLEEKQSKTQTEVSLSMCACFQMLNEADSWGLQNCNTVHKPWWH